MKHQQVEKDTLGEQRALATVPAGATAVPAGTALAQSEVPADWGAEDADSSDIVIPRVLLMQGLSDFVKQQKARSGDIVSSLGIQVIGDKENPVEMIPIKRATKQWMIEEQVGRGDKAPFVFKERVEWNPSNADWAKQEHRCELVNGVMTKRTLCLDYFVMLLSDLGGLPRVVSFRKTSFRTGQEMSTYFTTCKMQKRPPASRVFALGCHEKSKDGNSWFVFNLFEKRSTTKEELGAAFKWFSLMGKNPDAVKVDNTDDGEAGDAASEDAIPF